MSRADIVASGPLRGAWLLLVAAMACLWPLGCSRGHGANRMPNKLKHDLSTLSAAVERHMQRIGRLPTSWPELLAEWPDDRPFGKGRVTPVDPWRRRYVLIGSETAGMVVVGTLGMDGAAGGTDDSADYLVVAAR